MISCRKLNDLRKKLIFWGEKISTEMWQGLKEPPEFLEILHVRESFPLGQTIGNFKKQFNPKLPWADEHFLERISGKPLNPPPSHSKWSNKASDYLSKDDKFSHSYPERFWSKGLHTGIRFDIGDLNDLIDLLKSQKLTRQAYLPIYFPEDISAANQGERIPCTLGYHFIIRNNKLDVFYIMRSCDILRHLPNDLYLTARLAHYVLSSIKHKELTLGTIEFATTSLHCFTSDIKLLQNKILETDKLCAE